MCKRNLLLFLFVLTGFSGISQLVVDNTTLTPQQLIQNVLAGPGVTISNVTFNGVPVNNPIPQAGTFDGSNSNIGLPNGVLMGSGDVQVAPGPNNSGSSSLGGSGTMGVDPDLAAITPNQIWDEAILEFDFIPSGDTLSFNYVFASEEYDEYVCGTVNDAFGFFISGPGFAGPFTNGAENIALIPGTTTPVSINTVNLGVVGSNGLQATCDAIDPNWASYNVFYAGTNTQNEVQYDGWTVPLTASASVQCNQLYHIKLAIGDGGDSGFDSGVFLEASSFSSNVVSVAVSTVTGDTSIVEGCTDATFIFSRPASDTLDTLIINYDIAGTAIEGTDFSNLIDSVIFLPGEDTVIWNITAFLDQFNEGDEYITITTYTINACGDTLVSTGTLWISDPPIAIMTPSAVQGCQPFSVDFANNSTNGGIGPLTYEWIFTVNDTLMTPVLDTQNFVFNANSTVYLIAYDQYFCSDTTEVDIIVDICGCTDPNAENYYAFANVDDGSCIFLNPTVTAPNVFTPNGDGDNDLFELTHKNTVEIELVILNRWGNVMFETTAFNPAWDGTVDGKDAGEGTYFYKFYAHGKINSEGVEEFVEGHGFFHLFRD